MKIAMVVLLILSCCGCGGPGRSPCLKFTGYVSRDRAIALEQRAVEILADSKLVPESEFCSAFSPIVINVRRDYQWVIFGGGERVDGEFKIFSIDLSPDGRMLVHELLHAWEAEHLVLNTFRHPDWDKKNFWQAAAVYESSISSDQNLNSDPNLLNDPPFWLR